MITRYQRTGLGVSGAVILLALLWQTGQARDPDSSKTDPPAPDFRMDTVAILPFKNLSTDYHARNLVMPYVYREIAVSGFHLVFEPTVAQVLRRHRIRDTGQLNLKTARILGEESGAPLILMGSIDYLATDSPIQIGFSARLMDSRSGEIVWARSRYASGFEKAGFLGLKKTPTQDRLIKSELRLLFKSLRRDPGDRSTSGLLSERATSDRPGAVVIPFENMTGTRYVNQLVNNVFVSELTARGYRVIEPGRVNYALLSNFTMPQGEIDSRTLKKLAEEFGALYGFTGSVTQYQMISGPNGGQIPRVEINARMLDATTGTLIWAKNLERLGTDYTVLFEIGTVRSPGELIQKVVTEMLATLPNSTQSMDNYVSP